MKKLPINVINELANKLSAEVLIDIMKRMTDWKAAGGKDDDAYMWQQVRYAERCAQLE